MIYGCLEIWNFSSPVFSIPHLFAALNRELSSCTLSYIRCGISQGSILGPLLFLLYINDLRNCNLLSDVRMYADDTNLTFASKDPDELFSFQTRDLGNLKQWLDSNRVSLIVVKTKRLVHWD